MSTGTARPISPISTKHPQATKIGIGDVTSPNVAMKGALRDDILPRAIARPFPRPRFSTLSDCGVYLGAQIVSSCWSFFHEYEVVLSLRVNDGVHSVQPEVDHARKGQILCVIPNGSEGAREYGRNRGRNEQGLLRSEPFVRDHPHAEEWTEDADDGRNSPVAVGGVI